LVAETFIGVCPPDKTQIAHFDGNRLNNHWSNLRWATAKENCEDRVRHRSLNGSRNGRARLTSDQVKAARARYHGKHGEQTRLAREFGMSASAMRSVLIGEHWRYE
jgi:hypothetical protein